MSLPSSAPGHREIAQTFRRAFLVAAAVALVPGCGLLRGGTGGGTPVRHGTGWEDEPTIDDDSAESIAAGSARFSRAYFGVSMALARDAVLPGQPLVLEMTLNAAGAPISSERYSRIGGPGDPWRRRLTVLTLDKRGRFVSSPYRIRTIGGLTIYWPRVDPEHRTVSMNSSPHHADALDLSVEGSYSVSIVLEDGRTAPPRGPARLFLAFERPGATAKSKPEERWLISKSLDFEVVDPDSLSPEQSNALRSRRLLIESTVARMEGDAVLAERKAREAIDTAPTSLEARALLAGILEETGRLMEAYAEYERAWTHYDPGPGIAEPPTGLLFDMARIEELLSIEDQPLLLHSENADGTNAGFPLATSLQAVSGGRMTDPPFPANAARILLTWNAAQAPWDPDEQAPWDPVEARWIVEDTSGAVPADHRITTDLGDSGAKSGEFHLSAPQTGFLPGEYRVELWHAGRRIAVCRFRIESSR